MIAPDGTLNRRLLREKFCSRGGKSTAQCAVAPADSAGNAPPDAGRHLPLSPLGRTFAGRKPPVRPGDRVLVVDVPKETQIERTMLRDKVSREHAEHILAARPRASSARPSRTMLLKTLARRMQWHRMLPACTKSI